MKFVFLLVVNGETKIVEKKEIYENLYYNQAKLPTINEFNNIKNKIHKDIPYEIYIKKIKKKISKISSFLPLFDVKTMNLYLIKNDNVHHRITNDNYRLPTKKLLNNLNEIKKKYELNKTKNNHKKNYNEYIKSTEYFLEKINKMINFLLCFNLKTLKLSFYKLYFL